MKYFSILTAFVAAFPALAHAQAQALPPHEPSFYGVVLNKAGDDFHWPMVGFVNWAARDYRGLQLGFVNHAARQFSGLQLGLLNHAQRKTGGLQLGLLNVADSTQGLSLALLPIIRHGGYYSLALETNDFYPVSATARLGAGKLYTLYSLSYNPRQNHTWAYGAGVGSLLPLSKRFLLSPELTLHNTLERNNQLLVRFGLPLGAVIADHVVLFVGPTLSLQYDNHQLAATDRNPPVFSFYRRELTQSSRLVGGLQASARFAF